jgi:hypothetical protein
VWLLAQALPEEPLQEGSQADHRGHGRWCEGAEGHDMLPGGPRAHEVGTSPERRQRRGGGKG